MACAIDVSWVAPLIPKLKDPVDIDRLSGIKKESKEESKEEVRKAPKPERVEKLEAEIRGGQRQEDASTDTKVA